MFLLQIQVLPQQVSPSSPTTTPQTSVPNPPPQAREESNPLNFYYERNRKLVEQLKLQSPSGQTPQSPPGTSQAPGTQSLQQEALNQINRELLQNRSTFRVEGSRGQSEGSDPLFRLVLQLIGATRIAHTNSAKLAEVVSYLRSLKSGTTATATTINTKPIDLLYNLFSRIPFLRENGMINTTTWIIEKLTGAGSQIARAWNGVRGIGSAGARFVSAGASTQVAGAAVRVGSVLGFIAGPFLSVVGGAMAAADCIIDIGKACRNPSGTTVTNAAINTTCTVAGGVIGGIIGSALGPGGTIIGACVGASIGNLAGTIVKSAITKGGIINEWLFQKTGLAKAGGEIVDGFKGAWHSVFGSGKTTQTPQSQIPQTALSITA